MVLEVPKSAIGIGQNITQFKLNHEELQVFFSMSTDMFCIANFEGVVVEVNGAWEKVLGYSVSELVGNPVSHYIHPAELDKLEGVLDRLSRGETMEGMQGRCRSRDGSYKWLSWNCTPLIDRRLILAVVRDVTQEKAVIKATQDSEARYRSLFESAHSIRMIIDPVNYRIVDANQAACDFYGYNYVTLTSLYLRDINPCVPSNVSELINKGLKPEGNTLVVKHRLSDGQVRDVRIQAGPVVINDKTLLCADITDVTDHIRAQLELEESEARYRSLFESSNAVRLVIDPKNYRIVNANQTACEFYGYSRQELINLKITDINILPATEVDKAIQEALTPGGKVFFFKHRLASGELRDVQVHSGPVTVGGCTLLYTRSQDVTEQVAAQQRLKESEAVYHTLFESPHAIRMVLDPITRQIIDVNQAACDFYGYTYEELTELNISDINRGVPEEIANAMQQAMDGRNNVFYFQHWMRSGEIRDVQVSSGPVTINGRQMLYSQITDRTELLKSERQRQESEARYRSLFETPHAIRYVVDPIDFRIVEVNQAASRFYGYTREEMTKLNITDLNLQPECTVRHNANLALPEDGRIFNFIHRLASGELRDVQVHTGPVNIEGSQMLYSWVLDVTEHVRAQKELQETQSLNALIIDSLPYPAMLIDQDRNVVLANAMAVEMGVKKGVKCFMGFDVVTQMDTIIAGSACPFCFGELTLSTDKPYSCILQSMGRTWETHWIPVKKGEVFLHYAIDVTESKQLESTLTKARNAAEEASRAKSMFLANMSHEIRTPMNGIIGMTDLVLETPLSLEQQEFLELSKISAHSLLTIIDSILDHAKIEAGKLELVEADYDVIHLVEETVQLLEVGARHKGLRMELDFAPGIGAVRGDPFRLKQVLTNIIGNAVKFTEYGSVSVAVSQQVVGPDTLELSFSIKDTGAGIPEEKQSVLFQAFSQLDNSLTKRHGGSGLGLAISKQLVEMMGGTIGVASAEMVGSTFYFTVSVRPPSHVVQPEQVARPRGELFRGKVLAVDDNEQNLRIVKTMLSKRGYEVAVASSVACAWAMITQCIPDLLIVDLQMPEKDGLTFAREIRSSANTSVSTLPIIALTAFAMSIDRDRCLQAGMNDYVSKPFDQQKLLDTVAKWIREG